MPTHFFWNLTGIGLVLFLAYTGYGLAHYIANKPHKAPCEHEWSEPVEGHYTPKSVYGHYVLGSLDCTRYFCQKCGKVVRL